jgi:hypothetical protein
MSGIAGPSSPRTGCGGPGPPGDAPAEQACTCCNLADVCYTQVSFRFESRRRRPAMWLAAPDILQSYRLFDAIRPLCIADSIATSTGM